MPHVYLAKNYMRVKAAKEAGFTTCSLQGSSRSGKTYAIVQLLCVWCHDIAKTTVSIIRAGMPSIKRTVYRDFRDVMIAFGWWDDKCMNKSEFVYTFPNGSWIEFFSTDNEQKNSIQEPLGKVYTNSDLFIHLSSHEPKAIIPSRKSR